MFRRVGGDHVKRVLARRVIRQWAVCQSAAYDVACAQKESASSGPMAVPGYQHLIPSS